MAGAGMVALMMLAVLVVVVGGQWQADQAAASICSPSMSTPGATLTAGRYQVLDSTPSASPTIMGPKTLDAAQLVSWYGGQTPTVNGMPIAEVIGAYLQIGRAEGVRGDIAFVQAVHETGWFTSPDTALDNFAGIGHPATAASGIPFGGVGTGITAQIQLLKEAAEGNGVAMALPLAAPPWEAAVSPTWGDLVGRWATDPQYWVDIETLYSSALRSAGLPGLLPADTTGLAVCTPAAGTARIVIPADAPARLAQLLTFLQVQLGKPYSETIDGGVGPGYYDCSGLVQTAYRSIGVLLPRTTYSQYQAGVEVPAVADLRAGDLVFIPGSDPGPNGEPGHVGIYDGNGGIINAPYTGQVVHVDPLASWLPDIDYMRRIVNFT